MRASSFLALAFSGAAAADFFPFPTPNCKAVFITVNGTAQNRNITGIPTTPLSALTAFFQSAPVNTVTGPQTIAGTYCEPTVINGNRDRLQVLSGSITADRGAWQAQGGTGEDFPPLERAKYSWTDFANFRGYPTLAIDRLGTGKSSHPDPVLIVQAPYEIALYNDLASRIRAGSTGQLPRRFSDLTYIGNSYGSQLGAGLADAHPEAYTQYILTGFTDNFQQDFLGVSMTNPAPAAFVDPVRFGSLDPGYLTTSSQVGRTNSFFGSKQQVDYEDIVAAAFFQRKDVVSLGQFASVYGIPYVAPKYTGRVFVLNGEQDQAACGPGSPVIGPAHCGDQLRQTGTVVFPAANYNYKTVDRTGHAIQLHQSSQKVYDLAYRFLAGETFKGGPPA